MVIYYIPKKINLNTGETKDLTVKASLPKGTLVNVFTFNDGSKLSYITNKI